MEYLCDDTEDKLPGAALRHKPQLHTKDNVANGFASFLTSL